jgi:Protein of unknown function (DUF3405)
MAWKRTSSSGREAQANSRVRSRGESDIEKEPWLSHQPSEDDDDEEPISASSSSSTSSAHRPMLNRAYTSNVRSAFLLRPHSIMRWCCLGLAAMLVIFVVSLFHLSWRSARAVDEAVAEKIGPVAPPLPLYESFTFLERYYGGIRSLVPARSNEPEYPRHLEDGVNTNITDEDLEHPTRQRAIQSSVQFNPYPDYKSAEYVAQYGEKVDCFLDTQGTVEVPRVRMYEGIPHGFPDAVMGSTEVLGMRSDICYDRFGRLGPYGLGYSINRGGSGAQQEGEREGADLVWEQYPEVDFREVKWAEVQQTCAAANAHRFKELPKAPLERFRAMQIGSIGKRQDDSSEFVGIPPNTKPKDGQSEYKKGQETLSRTAVIIRTWWDYPYSPEDLIYLRSIISELSIMTGGEYTLHFLIHVKDNEVPIFSDDDTYERVLRDSLPEEFRGMGTLWNERQMHLMYGGLEETWQQNLPVHGVYRSTFMPMQYFAYQHPEYDYFWNWKMDVRSTNHWYHLFDSVTKWARKQPRKLLWERNSRFYVPFKHGTWDEFMHMVRTQTEQGTNSVNNLWSGLHAGGNSPGSAKQAGDRSIWGPERPLDDNVEFPDDPLPPTSFEKDKYEWGVGEDADLITFSPLFDPDGTAWLLSDDTTGYNVTQGRPPRRTAIITASRLSRQLLVMMHRETTLNHHTMFSEMWPASCALHHGLKVVYAPHPMYIDREWPIPYLESTFNAGRNGATGGARTSVFGEGRLRNFNGTTWYYNARFPEVLWHRWLGMRFNDKGGEQEEVNGEGRMCLPGMLLHPVKRVELVQEGRRADQ